MRWLLRTQNSIQTAAPPWDRSALPALARALDSERERWTRHAIEEATALIDLRAGDDPARTAAATRLGVLRSANALDRLRDVAADPTASSGLKQAALDAVKRVERWGLLTSTIDASIESHVMGFMAEQSRKTGKIESVAV